MSASHTINVGRIYVAEQSEEQEEVTFSNSLAFQMALWCTGLSKTGSPSIYSCLGIFLEIRIEMNGAAAMNGATLPGLASWDCVDGLPKIHPRLCNLAVGNVRLSRRNR